MITPLNILAAVLTLLPLLAAAFFSQLAPSWARRLPAWAQIVCPSALSCIYVLVTVPAGRFTWGWFALYVLRAPCIRWYGNPAAAFQPRPIG